ncbi:hypothetical protein BAE44_0017148 [Dichanthelium oligosanthes]|uniref:Uncharacterized protein n=1 Tax=Dichanthelium oligosanthes TaxID=888268 RepID=A0A1E5V9K0_9POAL|nr:hypothetical protein BAE44_0017148 [Dichanthelium oligosanthes]
MAAAAVLATVLLAKTCAHVMKHYFINATYCEPMLRQDKRSAVAKHPRDRALAMDLLQRGAADADAKVDHVLRSSAGVPRRNDTDLILR